MLRNIIRTRLQSALQKRPPGSGGRWRKRALILAGVTIAFFVLGHLGVRFVLWPQLEKSKPTLERLIAARLGTDVAIDDLQVSWTGIRPSFVINGLRFNKSGSPSSPLMIEHIDGQLSWLSFYHLAPYFHEITLNNVQLHAERDTKGMISIAGIPVHSKTNDFATENWLLDQNEIQINNATIFWEDQKSRKLKTSIEIENFHFTNGVRRHQGELTATTSWSPNPISIQANFVHHLGGQAGNWRDWIGTIAWDASTVKLSQIAQDISLPLYELGGNLSSKGSLKLDGGKADGGQIYLAVDRLKVQLNKEEDPIEFGRLETNLIQERDGGLNSITTKTLAWRNIDSPSSAPLENLSPMTFRWRPPEDGGEIKEFGFASPKIQLEDIALFALNLPLPKKIQHWIKTSEADGELQNFEINWSESNSALSVLPIPGNWFATNKLDFAISAKLNDVSFTGVNKSIPSVAHLSGNLTSNQKQGNFTIDSGNLELELSDFLSASHIQLDRAKGEISWSKQKGGWLINAKQLQLSNPEITTSFDLSYLIGGPKQPDQMTLDMEFSKAKLATAYRYLPANINKETRQYLSKAFESGDVQNGTLHIKGDPDQIPFPTGKVGELTLHLPISKATFKPAPLLPASQGVWSTFNNVSGNIDMKLDKLNIDIDKASYKKVALTNVQSQIPSVSAKHLTLLVNGLVAGEGAEVLEYLIASPVGIQQPSLRKNLSLTGPINLDLGLKLALSGNDDNKIDAKLSLPGNKVQWGDIPPLENLKGKIRITETNPEFEDVTANFLGGALKISSAAAATDNSSFNISGDMNASFIKDYITENTKSQTHPALLSAMSGSAKYEGLINFNKSGSQTNLKFDLRNWSSAAPAPAKKLAGTPLLGQLTVRTYTASKSNATRADWSGKFGDEYFVQGSLGTDNESRNAIGIGAPATMPPQGVALHIANNEFDLDKWLEFLDLGKNSSKIADTKKGSSPENNVQISAQVKKLIALEREWNDVVLNAYEKNQAWQIRVNAPQIAGQVQWYPGSHDQPSGLVSGRLSRLKIPDQMIAGETPSKASASPNQKPTQKTNPPKTAITPNAIPSLDLVIDDLTWSKAQLGTVKIKSKTASNQLKVESIQIINPQGNSNITGQWLGKTSNTVEQSSVTVDMNIKDAGHIISRWSNPKSVEGGEGKLDAKLNWSGSIFSPINDSLAGTVTLDLAKGRLLEVNTVGAKLLDVLSLQSLFRFATLDLQGSLGNLATKGTPFNSITGNFEIAQGVAQAKQFTMILDQARVAMTGQINLPVETQDLRITIFPTIDATAGSLAAFAINPIIGLGAVLGQYLITNQINRTMQTDYLVQGSWSNPEVIPLDQKGQPLDAKTLDTIRTKNLLKEQDKPSKPAAPSNNPSINPTSNQLPG
ncbi:YhdP family protein [Polynucleobacter sp. AP-Nino-20-G2]|uniref:YhdP family protein n=1 Tax=Polynucleobacter sp. AP-Nino-20-G2 TaxID=2576917 RepID=UPI00203E8189|nr:YhdP family protein [Polynucleobacter sp. AP-Nino-20-G2]QWE16392.1 TIGR02099 family protein [Polynucleobacter sp. AP-Nino-20-G2]